MSLRSARRLEVLGAEFLCRRLGCSRLLGAHLPQAFYRQGIPFIIVRTWSEGDRTVERKLKNLKNARLLCPICRVASLKSRPAYMKAWRARRKVRLA